MLHFNSFSFSPQNLLYIWRLMWNYSASYVCLSDSSLKSTNFILIKNIKQEHIRSLTR